MLDQIKNNETSSFRLEEATIVDLHEALEKLAAHDAKKARLVELRFFAGLTLPEAGACLGISPSTADRAWRYARAWLYAAMAGADPA